MKARRVAASVIVACALVSSVCWAAPAKKKRVRASAPAAFTVPFIEDDYARAVAAARAKKVPIFVEAWAPW